MVKSYLIGLFLSLLLFGNAYAQQTEESFKNELTYGINFNTNAGIFGGVSFRSAHPKSGNWLQFWGVDAVEVKHPKENRYLGQGGDVFVLGKINYLFVIRPEIGREYVFFRKAAESGVEVNGILGVGPSIGLLVPYYIDYDYTVYPPNGSGPMNPTDVRTKRYDPINKHKEFDTRIRGSSGFLTGIGETDINLGAHIKTAVSFEYGRYSENLAGVETGFLVEAYPKTLVMLPQAENYQVFTSVYLTLYYGRRK